MRSRLICLWYYLQRHSHSGEKLAQDPCIQIAVWMGLVTAALAHFRTFSSFYIPFCTVWLFLITSLWSSLFGQYGDHNFFALVLSLLFSLFSGVPREPVGSLIVYSRDQLLAVSSTTVPPHQRPDVPGKLKRKRRRCRARAARHRHRDATDSSSCLSSWGISPTRWVS